MKSIEDTLQEIFELIEREQAEMTEIRREVGTENSAFSMAMGARDVLRELREWILEL